MGQPINDVDATVRSDRASDAAETFQSLQRNVRVEHLREGGPLSLSLLNQNSQKQ